MNIHCEFSSRFHSDSKRIRSGFVSKRRESPRTLNIFAQQYGFANFGRVFTVIHCETLSWELLSLLLKDHPDTFRVEGKTPLVHDLIQIVLRQYTNPEKRVTSIAARPLASYRNLNSRIYMSSLYSKTRKGVTHAWGSHSCPRHQ